MPATAATRAPRGAVSVPLPRTPRENIRSNTGESIINNSIACLFFKKKKTGKTGECGWTTTHV